MAKRPIYISDKTKKENIKIENLDFEWFAGFSISQKQKSIKSLQNTFISIEKYKNYKILEVSSKSEEELGIKLSAFNLSSKGKTVEVIFQGSKVFENGGPYTDIYNLNSRQAKKDERLKNSGNLKCFEYRNEKWGLEPKTAFYDWIYINILEQNHSLKEELIKKGYRAFTDIEFNPKKSINCQAKALALYISLIKKGTLEVALKGKEFFLKEAYEWNEKGIIIQKKLI
jgi:hypothetical protein